MSCRCSIDALDLPMEGTYPKGRRWLFLEYPGAWGNYAVRESHLPDEVKDFLDGLVDRGEYRVKLIRRHTRPHLRLDKSRLVFRVDLDASGDARCEAATVTDPRELLGLGALPWAPHPDQLVLICTNGKRDECCARIGRPVAAALEARWPELTWEVTHIGGHKFAATGMVLPAGAFLGRLTPEAAVTQVERALRGEAPEPAYDRGPAPSADSTTSAS